MISLRTMVCRASVGALVFALGLFLVPFAVHAKSSPDLSIIPVVVDEKARARDILKKEVVLKNTSNRKLNLYPAVNDINPQEGEQKFVSAQDASDRAASLANWIELSRGVVELMPGEERTIPFVVRVNLNAVPGRYHAIVSFFEGSTRAAAEEDPGLAYATVNLEVLEDAKEIMQLNSFATDNMYFAGDDIVFRYQFENIGNQTLQPAGDIRVYDRKGKEVASVVVNERGEAFEPDKMGQLASVWSGARGFGKYKALINVNYGSQTASVQDTVFFWIVPWQHLLAILVVSLLLVLFLTLYIHRWHERRYLAKMGLQDVVGMPVPQPAGVAPLLTNTPAPLQQTSGEKKPGMFARMRARFSRKKKEVAVVATPSVFTPTQSTSTAQMPVQNTPAVSHTIDLKSMGGSASAPQSPRTHDMVINLKKGS